MTIGLLQIDLVIPGSRSLKQKRRALNSLKQVLRNKFNCSVAEIGYKDNWSRTQLAVCVVSDESRHANSQLSEIVRFASSNGRAEMVDHTIEML